MLIMTPIRPVSWFLTEAGRRFSFIVIAGTGVTCTVMRYAPNTLLLEKYKDFVHNYNNGKPVELNNDLQSRVSKCLDILKISDVQRKLIAPFSVFGPAIDVKETVSMVTPMAMRRKWSIFYGPL